MGVRNVQYLVVCRGGAVVRMVDVSGMSGRQIDVVAENARVELGGVITTSLQSAQYPA